MNPHVSKKNILHKLPSDLRAVIYTSPQILLVWNDITPLARNEWIYWVENAKKTETRARRITKLQRDLLQGNRRPCCWAGCNHRGT